MTDLRAIHEHERNHFDNNPLFRPGSVSSKDIAMAFGIPAFLLAIILAWRILTGVPLPIPFYIGLAFWTVVGAAALLPGKPPRAVDRP